MNNKFLKSELSEITLELLSEVITYAYSQGHKSYAALGCSGDDFLLYGESRRREISLRLHSGDVKLLVTDNIGNFLFNGGFDTSLLPVSFIANQYYYIIQNVKYLLDNTTRNPAITEEDKYEMLQRKQILKSLFIITSPTL